MRLTEQGEARSALAEAVGKAPLAVSGTKISPVSTGEAIWGRAVLRLTEQGEARSAPAEAASEACSP